MSMLTRQVMQRGGSWDPLSQAERKDIADVIRLLRGAAEQEHAKAQRELGCMYSKGEITTKNEAEAA